MSWTYRYTTSNIVLFCMLYHAVNYISSKIKTLFIFSVYLDSRFSNWWCPSLLRSCKCNRRKMHIDIFLSLFLSNYHSAAASIDQNEFH